jgi:hypothetical protein
LSASAGRVARAQPIGAIGTDLWLTVWPVSEHRTPWIRTSRGSVRRMRRRTFRAPTRAPSRPVRTDVRRGRTTARRVTNAAPRNEPCCASSLPVTRRRCRRVPRRRPRTAAGCLATSSASTLRICVRHPRTRLHARTLPDLPRRDPRPDHARIARRLAKDAANRDLDGRAPNQVAPR